ncbi:MAG: hypothetical protein EXR39_14955 [Betaproteobacteria bacterium]|nr:hypothetical protein [Betaproteobacteria bacterium]
MKQLLVLLAALVLGQLAFAQQKLDGLPLNTAVSGTLEYGNKRIILPDGEWVLIASGTWFSNIGNTQRGAPMGGAWLAQTRDNQLLRLIYVLMNLEQQSFANGWIEDPCKRGTVFAKTDWSRNPSDQYCMTVNHYVGLMSNPTGWSRQALVWFEKSKVAIPRTMVAVDFHRVTRPDLVNIRYYFNPEVDGIASAIDRAWATSEWQKDLIEMDPVRLAYAQDLKRWGEAMRLFVLAAIDRKKAPIGASPAAPFPKDPRKLP